MIEGDFVIEASLSRFPETVELIIPGSGYYVLVGQNNSGKTKFLKSLISKLDDSEKGKAAYIASPKSNQIHLSNQTDPGKSPDIYLAEAATQIAGQTYFPEGHPGNGDQKIAKYHQEVFASLWNHAGISNSDVQSNLSSLLSELGQPSVRIFSGNRISRSDNRSQEFGQFWGQGGGYQSLVLVALCLSHPEVRTIFIDEPEESLEPRLQKNLVKKLQEIAEDKLIVVSTHSHLFLNNNNIDHNFTVERLGEENNRLSLRLNAVKDDAGMKNVVFNMLGASLEDLFLPSNYVICEGASDQAILNKILRMRNLDRKIKVISAGGIDGVKASALAIERVLIPYVAGQPPYKNKVCAIVDKDGAKADSIKKYLKSPRFEQLSSVSLEDYLHTDLYELAGLNKNEKLSEIKKIKQRRLTPENKQKKVNDIKLEISRKISEKLDESHIEKYLKEFDSIIKKAILKSSES